eukprot:scaffold440_cov277-Ochromonas_danica.AAC.20
MVAGRILLTCTILCTNVQSPRPPATSGNLIVKEREEIQSSSLEMVKLALHYGISDGGVRKIRHLAEKDQIRIGAGMNMEMFRHFIHVDRGGR